MTTIERLEARPLPDADLDASFADARRLVFKFGGTPVPTPARTNSRRRRPATTSTAAAAMT